MVEQTGTTATQEGFFTKGYERTVAVVALVWDMLVTPYHLIRTAQGKDWTPAERDSKTIIEAHCSLTALRSATRTLDRLVARLDHLGEGPYYQA